jgi:hypothetical protein
MRLRLCMISRRACETPFPRRSSARAANLAIRRRDPSALARPVSRRLAILGQLPNGANLSQLDEASRKGLEGALAEARTNASAPSSAAPSTKAISYAMLLCVAEMLRTWTGSQTRFLRNEPNLKNLHRLIAAPTGQHNPLDVQSDAPVIAAAAGATCPSWRGRLRSLSHNRHARVSGSRRQRRN